MNFKSLADFMDMLTGWRIPGNSCEVYYKREKVFTYSSGFSDAKSGIKKKADDVLYAYSASKVITCTAALQLFEKGKFLLTDPLEKYISEWGHVTVRHKLENGGYEIRPAQNKVLVKDLFTMSAGLDYNIFVEPVNEVKRLTDSKYPTVEVAKALAKEPLHFEPGTRWNYSLCHDVLGALIEVVSGQRLKDYAAEHIFKPCRMNDTKYGLDNSNRSRLIKQYNFDDNQDRYFETDNKNFCLLGDEFDSGGAGVVSTVSDMALFADALCAGGVTQSGERILSPHTIELMHTNCLNETQLKDFAWEQLRGYGYGLGVRTLIDKADGGSPSPIGEFGWTGAAGAYMLIDTKNELAMYYSSHMLNNQEPFTVPRLRNILYGCID